MFTLCTTVEVVEVVEAAEVEDDRLLLAPLPPPLEENWSLTSTRMMATRGSASMPWSRGILEA